MRFTRRQGQYLAFIGEYTEIHGIPPAEADMQQYFGVTAPAVHQMVVTLDRKGLVARLPGQPRTIRVLVPPAELPRLARTGSPGRRQSVPGSPWRTRPERFFRHEVLSPNATIAIEFLRRFGAGDVGGLAELLADDLDFQGPLHRSNSSRAYVKTLRDDPPRPAEILVSSLTEGGADVSVYYEYVKGDGEAVTVAQLFSIRAGRICRILMVFDTGEHPATQPAEA